MEDSDQSNTDDVKILQGKLWCRVLEILNVECSFTILLSVKPWNIYTSFFSLTVQVENLQNEVSEKERVLNSLLGNFELEL